MSSGPRAPQLVGVRCYLRGIFFFEDECQIMKLKVLEPFFPGDLSKRSEAGKIESNAGTSIVDVHHRRT